MSALARVLHEIRADVAAARDRDPAAQGVSTLEILASWAGVQALLTHRVAHALLVVLHEHLARERDLVDDLAELALDHLREDLWRLFLLRGLREDDFPNGKREILVPTEADILDR